MPVVAVVAAVALDASAIGTVVAGGFAALGTLSAITAIGATLGAIGVVTGNKTLGIVGGAIGLVGGIGTLAMGSDALGSVGDLFGSSTADAGSAAGVATDSLGVAGGAAPDALGVAGGAAGAPTTAALDASGNITTATGALNTAAFNPTGIINSAISPAEGSASGIVTGGDASSALAGTMAPPATGASLTPGATAGMGDTAFSSGAGGIQTMSMSGVGSLGSTPGGILNWAKNNQLLSYGILQAGGSFISGLTNPMTPAQIQALQAQAAYNNAAAALTQREAQNVSSGMPGASVTGKPATQQSIINNSPILKAAPVTGTINTTSAPSPGAVTGAPT